MIFAYWLKSYMVCERSAGDAPWSAADLSMRNESHYVPSRVNRDKLFFMFPSYKAEKKEEDWMRSALTFPYATKLWKVEKKSLKCTHQENETARCTRRVSWRFLRLQSFRTAGNRFACNARPSKILIKQLRLTRNDNSKRISLSAI